MKSGRLGSGIGKRVFPAAIARRSPTLDATAKGAVGTPWKASVSLVRALSRQRERVNGSLPEYGIPKNSQIAGTWASRFTPVRPSAMLKTMSGREARSRAGKSSSASRRMTLPQAESALATASRVSTESHSAKRSESDAVLGGLSVWDRLSATSGFWLYANPIRVIARVDQPRRFAVAPSICPAHRLLTRQKAVRAYMRREYDRKRNRNAQ